MNWIIAFGAVGGLAGLGTTIRLIFFEPKVARRDETKMLWDETYRLRSENKSLGDKVYDLQRQVLQCETDKNHLQDRVAALEAARESP